MPYQSRRPPTMAPITSPSSSGKGLVIGPTASPSGGARPSSATLTNAAQTQAARETVVGGWGSIVPMVYGRTKLGGTIAVCKTKTGTTRGHVLSVWSQGRCGGVNVLYLEDDLASKLTGWTAQHFYGTATQTYPAGLHAAFPDYEDNLPGIAGTYMTFGMGYTGKDPFKTAAADFSGRWLYDPREVAFDIEDVETWAWSQTPALALADWICHDDGEGRGFDSMNWDSVGETAEWNDSTLNDLPRHTIGLAIREIRPVREWREVLRAYAHCILYQDGGKTVMVPDKPRSISHYFNAANGDIVPDSLQIFTKREEDLPNVVEVDFTDRDNDWAPGLARVATGDETKTVRKSMPGITNYAEAYREALETANRYTLLTRTFRCELFSKGEKATPGDRAQIDDENLPITAGQFCVLNKRRLDDRRWGLEGEAYDDNVYSNVVAIAPVYASSDDPSPFAPPVPTGLTAEEDTKLLKSDVYVSSLIISWDDMRDTWPYVGGYSIAVNGGGKEWFSKIVDDNATSVSTGTLQEGVTYQVSIKTISDIDSKLMSVAATYDVPVEGNDKVPNNVDRFTFAREIGGEVQLFWNKALGAVAYHIRYGDSWETSTLVTARHDSTAFSSKSFPPGTYVFRIKALGPTGLESEADAFATVVVTTDDRYHFVGEHTFGFDELNFTGFSGYEHDGVTTVFTANGETHSYGYTGTTWEELSDVPWMLPRNTFGGAIETDAWEFSAIPISVQVNIGGIEPTLVEHGDTAAYRVEIGLSDTGSTWAWVEGTNIQGGGAFLKVRITDLSDGPNAGLVFENLNITATLVAVERYDEGAVTLTASQPEAVEFAKLFTATVAGWPQLTITACAESPVACRADNVTPEGFDCHLYRTDTGAAVPGEVAWVMKGV